LIFFSHNAHLALIILYFRFLPIQVSFYIQIQVFNTHFQAIYILFQNHYPFMLISFILFLFSVSKSHHSYLKQSYRKKQLNLTIDYMLICFHLSIIPVMQSRLHFIYFIPLINEPMNHILTINHLINFFTNLTTPISLSLMFAIILIHLMHLHKVLNNCSITQFPYSFSLLPGYEHLFHQSISLFLLIAFSIQ
jgi:membrane-associated HD superfamily phosphohydrolase